MLIFASLVFVVSVLEGLHTGVKFPALENLAGDQIK
jgi:hypothetical protein